MFYRSGWLRCVGLRCTDTFRAGERLLVFLVDKMIGVCFERLTYGVYYYYYYYIHTHTHIYILYYYIYMYTYYYILSYTILFFSSFPNITFLLLPICYNSITFQHHQFLLFFRSISLFLLFIQYLSAVTYVYLYILLFPYQFQN